jgi:hypothetical protein
VRVLDGCSQLAAFLTLHPCRLLLSRLPQETLTEARRVAAESAGAGVRNTVVANPRWLPGMERVRKIRRSLKSAHRLSRDEQTSLLQLIEEHELTDEGRGNVVFTQTQVCICHDRDFQEERLALQRQRKKQARMLELLRVQQRALLTAADAGDIEERVAKAQEVLSEMDGKLAALDAEVRLRSLCFPGVIRLLDVHFRVFFFFFFFFCFAGARRTAAGESNLPSAVQAQIFDVQALCCGHYG